MSSKASDAEIRQIRQLMGSHLLSDNDRAEHQLSQYDPHELPTDILDSWTKSHLQSQNDRSGRVQTAWRERRHRRES